MGSLNAIIPMKCIDQMPTPIVTAPPASHSFAKWPCERATWAERFSAA